MTPARPTARTLCPASCRGELTPRPRAAPQAPEDISLETLPETARRQRNARSGPTHRAQGRAPPSGQARNRPSHRLCYCHAALDRGPVLLSPSPRLVPSTSGALLPAAPLVHQSNPPSGHETGESSANADTSSSTGRAPQPIRVSRAAARRPRVAVATGDAPGRAAARAVGWGLRASRRQPPHPDLGLPASQGFLNAVGFPGLGVPTFSI